MPAKVQIKEKMNAAATQEELMVEEFIRRLEQVQMDSVDCATDILCQSDALDATIDAYEKFSTDAGALAEEYISISKNHLSPEIKAQQLAIDNGLKAFDNQISELEQTGNQFKEISSNRGALTDTDKLLVMKLQTDLRVRRARIKSEFDKLVKTYRYRNVLKSGVAMSQRSAQMLDVESYRKAGDVEILLMNRDALIVDAQMQGFLNDSIFARQALSLPGTNISYTGKSDDHNDYGVIPILPGIIVNWDDNNSNNLSDEIAAMRYALEALNKS